MEAGKLDRRITILRAVNTGNAFNEPVASWEPLATVWASKEDIRDGERIRAQTISADITTRFQIRHSTVVADVNAKDRVLCEGKTYDIFSVKEIGQRVGFEITATARAD